jgi:DNA repair exonuclease SbcCD nuclease subunit
MTHTGAFRFVHAADLHLDSPLDGLTARAADLGREVAAASRRAFAGLIDLTLERQAAFLVIAGDVFDGAWRDLRSGLLFADAMARLERSGIPVVMVRGNHDAESRVGKALHCPNVHQFNSRRPHTIRLEQHRTALHGCSYARQDESRNLAQDYPEALPCWLNIGVLHTALAGSSLHLPYAPCSLDDLLNRGYQYWALGHVHAHAALHQDPPVIYPGNLQGRHVHESGPKGCVVAEVADQRVAGWEFVALDSVRWAEVTVEAAGCAALDEVLERVRDELALAAEGLDGRVLAVRLGIAGTTAAHGALHADRARLEAEAQAAAFRAGSDILIERVTLRTRAAAAHLPGPDALGEIVRAMASLRDERDALRSELAAIVQKLPDAAKEVIDWTTLDDAALDAVLDDAHPLLTERLRAEGVA